MQQTVEALAFSVRRGTIPWTCAANFRFGYFRVGKTLRNYRRLFIEQGLDELLFRSDRMVQGFSVDTSHQRMDSTALRSAMRALTRLGIVVESISKFARELEAISSRSARADRQGGDRRYSIARAMARSGNTAPVFQNPPRRSGSGSPRQTVLQFRDTRRQSFPVLRSWRVLRDQFEIVDDQCGDRDAKRACDSRSKGCAVRYRRQPADRTRATTRTRVRLHGADREPIVKMT